MIDIIQTTFAVVIAAMVVPIAAVNANAPSNEKVEESNDGEILVGIVENGGDNSIHQILVRPLGEISAVQFDVIVNDEVVSFLRATGADRRAVCELVFFDEDAWFGWCDVFDFQFSTFEEWKASYPKCRDCTTIRRFFFAAGTQYCGPTYLGEPEVLGPKGDLGLQAAFELSNWAPEEVAVLRQALRLVGSYGCPRLGRELIEFLSVDTSAVLNERDLSSSTVIPESIEIQFDHERLNGLTEWLEHAVDRIP